MPAPAAGAPITSAPTYPNTPSGPYSTVPGYAPAPTAPTYPQGAVPGASYPPGTYPQGTYPQGTYPQGTPTPADQPPRLDPGAVSGFPSTNTQRLAVPQTGSSIVVPGPPAGYSAPTTSGYSAPTGTQPSVNYGAPATPGSSVPPPPAMTNPSAASTPGTSGTSAFGGRSVAPPTIGSSNSSANPAPPATPTAGTAGTSTSGSESSIRPVQDPAPDLRIPVDPARATGEANDQQTWSPAVRPWNYSPVRQAVYRGQEIEGTPTHFRQESAPAAAPSFGPAPDPNVNRPYGPATNLNPAPATAVDHGWRSLGR